MADGRPRVVVTGMGVVAPLGIGLDEFWANAIAGRSGVGRMTQADPTNYPCQVAGEVTDFDYTLYMDRKDGRRMARFSQLAIAAARMAIDHAGLDLERVDRERVGVVMGNGGGGLPNDLEAVRTIDSRGGMKVDPFYVSKRLSNMAGGNVAIQFGLLGYNTTVTTACAAGTQAIGEAMEVIRRGAADVVIAGGAEAGICELGLAGFASMRALSTGYNDTPERASRPFDRDRDGFVPAEGSGLLVLESLEHARARGAEPLAEIVGYGCTADAAYLVAPAENGAGAARAMRLALRDAAVDASEVDVVSAHATSTDVGDRSETEAIKAALGEHASKVMVSAMKSQIGHLLGAAGGVETIALVQALRTGIVPPTLNLDNPSEGCDLDYVPHEARDAGVRIGVKNSFGFGGQNAVLVLRRFEG
ncbi:MAG: beta-ketoacyl-[acyl-carrier-protein] synthase II [Chloroflexi bacterium HGW-Chloroflexi-9]|nr:MAG: beta-ketoacyl-[acyl-carrier-protein] synthase II [Chloroflexi bacterium HGW-Chloroflexi-9]